MSARQQAPSWRFGKGAAAEAYYRAAQERARLKLEVELAARAGQDTRLLRAKLSSAEREVERRAHRVRSWVARLLGALAG